LPYLNIHTHHPLPNGEATVPSFGLHPWHLTVTWREELETLVSQYLAMESQVKETALSTNDGRSTDHFFIGECGLDRICATPYDLQLKAFEAQIELSERFGVPLILHCVRALDDVLRLKRGTRQPWIFHGFRGKPQQLEQLLSHGFYVSFGFRHHEESLRLCPSDRLFLETDDVSESIVSLYETAAKLRLTTPEALNNQCWSNLRLVEKA